MQVALLLALSVMKKHRERSIPYSAMIPATPSAVLVPVCLPCCHGGLKQHARRLAFNADEEGHNAE